MSLLNPLPNGKYVADVIILSPCLPDVEGESTIYDYFFTIAEE